jgi:hypothetical protein
MAHTVSMLRSLLAARFPEKGRADANHQPTGCAPVDDALGGGLATGRLTEVVSSSAGTGGQTLLASLLESTLAVRRRMALVDAADGFAPGCVRPALLRHLVWVRCDGPDQALAALDLLVRDPNYAVVAMDLRGCPERELRRIPTTVWYRIGRAAEAGPAAVVIHSPFALVPAVPERLVLDTPFTLDDGEHTRARVAAKISVRPERARFAFQERAG